MQAWKAPDIGHLSAYVFVCVCVCVYVCVCVRVRKLRACKSPFLKHQVC